MSKFNRPKYCWLWTPIGRRLDQLFEVLRLIQKRNNDMSAEFNTLVAQVSSLQAGVAQAISVLQSLVVRLSSSPSPSELVALSQSVQSITDGLASAVASVPQ